MLGSIGLHFIAYAKGDDCYDNQLREIPFKEVGLLLKIKKSAQLSENSQIYVIHSKQDFEKYFDLKDFRPYDIESSKLDFSKTYLAVVSPNSKKDILDMKVDGLSEKNYVPGCFGCYDFGCMPVILGVSLLMKIGDGNWAFPSPILLIELDAPADLKNEEIEPHVHVKSFSIQLNYNQE